MVKSKSRIIDELHDTVRGLHEIGLIDDRRMREFDALGQFNLKVIPPQKIKSLRERSHVSQAVFAAILNTSVSTVREWEIGDKKPSGPSLKLLNLIERKGLEAIL